MKCIIHKQALDFYMKKPVQKSKSAYNNSFKSATKLAHELITASGFIDGG